MSKKKLPPEVLHRLEASRKVFKALRHWHFGQIQRLDRLWGNEGTNLLTATPYFQNVSLERLEASLKASLAALPADALKPEEF
jgi:hypothetical protein